MPHSTPLNDLSEYTCHTVWLGLTIVEVSGIPVGEIVVGDVVGFVVGLTLLGFMAKHTTYGFGEKVWKPGIRKVRQEWRGQEIRKETFSFEFVQGKPGWNA